MNTKVVCYVSIRITKAFETNGIKTNQKRVSRLMRVIGLMPKGFRYKIKKYNQKYSVEEYPNNEALIQK